MNQWKRRTPANATEPVVPSCDRCELPIRTRYMVSYAIGSRDESFMALFCMLCWDDLLPQGSRRELMLIARDHPMERRLF